MNFWVKSVDSELDTFPMIEFNELMTTLESIRVEARSLPLDEREALLAVMDFDLRSDQSSPEHASDPDVEAEWDIEIEKRLAEIQSGKVELLSHDGFISVFDEARGELRQRTACGYVFILPPVMTHGRRIFITLELMRHWHKTLKHASRTC